jgi:hypothetical protein
MDPSLSSLLDRIQALELSNASLRDQLANTNSSSQPHEPKVPLPEKFDGDRRHFRGFINQIELVFMINPSRYQSSASKVGVIGTLLKDKALAWFSPYLENAERYQDVLNDYPAFRCLLEDTFGEKDRALVAASKIGLLRQGNRPAASYASDFRQLASDLTWNDSALIHQFRLGLSSQVKDMLVHHPQPSTLDEMISLAISVDNRLFEHRQEMRRFSPMTSVRTPASSSRTNAPSGPVPMEIGSIRSGRLSEEEKQRRRDNNLCMYCGSSDHLRPVCPVAPSRSTSASGNETLH